MKYYANTLAAIAVAMAAAAPSFAAGQLAANAGLTPVEAQGLSLTQIAQAKFNRDASRQEDRAPVVINRVVGTGVYPQLAASAGLSPAEAQGLSLTQIALAKYNRNKSGDEQQPVKAGGVSMGTRSVETGHAGRDQLIASAGLTAEEAAGLSLSEIAAVKFNRDTRSDDYQRAPIY